LFVYLFTYLLTYLFIFVTGTVLKDEDTISNAGIGNGDIIFAVLNTKERDINITVNGV
jgi:hypothetical protein